MAKEKDERVTSAWKRFGQNSTFLRDQRMPMCLKRKIMNTVILPSMTYAAETWSLTNRQREKLAVTQRSMERSMLDRLNDTASELSSEDGSSYSEESEKSGLEVVDGGEKLTLIYSFMGQEVDHRKICGKE
eukprot:gene9645-17406_t